MKENEIVNFALENLLKNVGITGKWRNIGPKELDGQLEIVIESQSIKLNAQIKNELRSHQLEKIIALKERYGPLIVIANRLLPIIKEELRKKQISFLESNGNIFIRKDAILLWVDGQKPIKPEKEKGNRAFTKTGLKIVFHFLLNENFINLPYREIARITEVGLGNINNVLNGLKDLGFLIKLNKEQYKLVNKKQLLDKWAEAYTERLKPAVKIGTFRFLAEEDFTNWQNLPLRNGKTWWGGEPAADLLTNYLRPMELSLYTVENRNDLIKNYRLIPDEKGNVKIYNKFWNYDEVNKNIVPSLLIYADLISSNDRRCNETAKIIYDELLQNRL